MTMRLPNIWTLTWSDVDPAGLPAFDPAGVADLVRSLPPAVVPHLPAPVPAIRDGFARFAGRGPQGLLAGSCSRA